MPMLLLKNLQSLRKQGDERPEMSFNAQEVCWQDPALPINCASYQLPVLSCWVHKHQKRVHFQFYQGSYYPKKFKVYVVPQLLRLYS